MHVRRSRWRVEKLYANSVVIDDMAIMASIIFSIGEENARSLNIDGRIITYDA